jgi:transposase
VRLPVCPLVRPVPRRRHEIGPFAGVLCPVPRQHEGMDKPRLEQLLAEGLSLAEIGRRVGRHEATVSYWLRRHGLRAANAERHAARGGLTRELLSELVDAGLSIAEIAKETALSKGTVRHWLKHYGLRTEPARRKARLREARAAALRTVNERCRRHGVSEHFRDREGYYRCKRCRTEGVMRRRRRVKQILIAEAGGRCRLCGYDRYAGALHFHHLDPATKSFGLAMNGRTPSIAKLRLEAQKCVLLCSNCHAEVEAGIARISVVAQSGSPG